MNTLVRNVNRYIIVNPETCGGRPVFRNTRIPVTTILELIEGGMSTEDILRGYPALTKKFIQAALQYAIERIENEEFIPLASR